MLQMERLITEVRKRPALWNTYDKNYKNRAIINDNWAAVSRITGFSKEEVKTKWKNLRDNFKKELNKSPHVKSEEFEESVLVYKGKWLYFYAMLFLKDVMNPQENFVNCTSADEQALERRENSDDTDNEFLMHDSLVTNASDESASLHCRFQNTAQHTTKKKCFKRVLKKRMIHLNAPYIKPNKRKALPLQETEDDDLQFLKSLLPYFKTISTIRKLHVRNQFQTILIQELSASTSLESCVSESNIPN